ncbi:MAG: hypothetical protein WDM81_04050 [Rhizomicrobium sp.]
MLLSVSALALRLAISLPLAILAARSRVLRGSCAGPGEHRPDDPRPRLLALFYPLLLIVSHFTLETFGFGFRALGFLPALLALALYSMLPVLRNTITAPRRHRSRREDGGARRRHDARPVAVPGRVAARRTAHHGRHPHRGGVGDRHRDARDPPSAQTSLGNYIFTGLQTENWVFVLFGVVSAALLAIVIDRLLALAEDGLALRSRGRVVAALIGIAIVIGASLYPMFASTAGTVVIGAKSFDEQYIWAMSSPTGCPPPHRDDAARRARLDRDLPRARRRAIWTSMSTIPARSGPAKCTATTRRAARRCWRRCPTG